MQKIALFSTAALLLLCAACRWQSPEDRQDFGERSAPVSESDTICEYEILPERETPEPETHYEASVAFVTPDFLEDIRLKRLQNPDTVGWLALPDTAIDAVVVQNPPEMRNNQFYLDVDFDRAPDRNGTFCADYRSSLASGTRESLSRITTVFGHSWSDDADDALFAQLKRYREPEFAETHPYLFLSTREENMAWEVFAVFDATVDLPYIEPHLDDNKMYDLLELVGGLSEYHYDVAVSPEDKLLVLSTCTYSVRGQDALPDYNDYRFVIMAKLIEPGAARKDTAVFCQNENPLIPDQIVEVMGRWRTFSLVAGGGR